MNRNTKNKQNARKIYRSQNARIKAMLLFTHHVDKERPIV